MASTIDNVKREWRAFKHDEPGVRFQHQHDRMQKKAHSIRIAQAAAGLILTIAGIVLLFVPGPGLLVMVFGLALLAGLSNALAKLLDRAEPPLRHEAQLLRRGWHRLAGSAKVGLAGLALVGLGAIGFGAYGLIT
jgi:hypothetical protein